MRIRWGKVKTASNDKGPFKLVEVESDGHVVPAKVVEGYGMQGSPPVDSIVLLMPLDGDEGKLVALCMAPPKDRMDQHKEGELSSQHYKTKNRLTHRNNGNSIIRTKGILYINSDGGEA